MQEEDGYGLDCYMLGGCMMYLRIRLVVLRSEIVMSMRMDG